jgi:hypothetical protein
MSSSHVLIVPLIAIGIIGLIVVIIALVVAGTKMHLIRTQDRLLGHQYQEMVSHARKTDDLMCSLIGEIEHSPATADTLLAPEMQQEIYDAHSRYVELGTTRKGIS